MTAHLPRAFTDALYDCGLPYIGCHLLIAFSGGADSTALLHMAHTLSEAQRMPFAVSAVHVHHGIRDAEADRDADFCRTFCETYGIPFTLYRCDVPALAKCSGRSLEEEAREQRYAFFSRHLDAHPDITHLLTAHHADDQAETVLFRLLRGTSPAGLSGIPTIRDFAAGQHSIPLIRPLLGLSKDKLLAYCREHGLSYVTDSTNLSTDCTRNLLRRVLLPAAKEVNPAFSAALQRLSSDAALDEDYFTCLTDAFLREHTVSENPPALRRDVLLSQHPAVAGRILASLYRKAGITVPCTHRHLDAMRGALARADGIIRLPDGFFFYSDGIRNICRITREQQKKTVNGTTIVPIPTVLPLPPGTSVPFFDGSVCFLSDRSPENEKKLRDLKNVYKFFISTHINSDKILGSISLRPRADNKTDVYLCGHSRKTVRDVLSAHRVPHDLRGDLPLFCDGGGIIWVPFCGIRDDVNPKETVDGASHISDLYYFSDMERIL